MKDPVTHCPVYKAESCPHVDGYLCEVETCDIITNWVRDRNNITIEEYHQIVMQRLLTLYRDLPIEYSGYVISTVEDIEEAYYKKWNTSYHTTNV